MRRLPRLVVALLVGASLLLLLPHAPAQAQSPRLAAFQLQCYVPTLPGYHTRATLIGTFVMANRTTWTVASCADGPSPANWPEFDAADGAVQAMYIVVVTVLENAEHDLVDYNYCEASSTKGYVILRCAADPQGNGEVQVLASIAP
jgi:hypothetical protein